MHCIPGSSFILTSRRLSFFRFQHIGEFGKLLDDRQLIAAFIHFSMCLNPSCREANNQAKKWLTSNPEIPSAIIGRMEAWRSKVEGWPPRLGSDQPPGEPQESS